MILMGVDPSKRNTGIVVFDTTNFSLLYQGTIRNGDVSEQQDVTPFRRIRAGVGATIEQYKPNLLCLEKMFQSLSPLVSEMLFIAAFCVRWAASDEGVPARTVPITGKNTGWYHFILGNSYTKMRGGIGKINARKAVESALGVQFKNEHIADAASIALTGYFHETGIDFRDVVGAPKPDFTETTTKKATVRKPRKKKETL